MAYPSNFSFDILKSNKSFKSKLEYVKSILPRIGGGSSRAVFAVDDSKVLKVAKNKKGLLQNRSEDDYVKQQYDIVAKVFDSDRDNYFIEMERAKKVSEKRFFQLTDISISDLESILRYESSLDNSKIRGTVSRPIVYTDLSDNQFLIDLLSFLRDFGLMAIYGDYCRLSSFGEVIRIENEVQYPVVVLVDFGLDRSAADLYFK